MAWYRCEANAVFGEADFAVTRFVQADGENAAAMAAVKTVGRELVRRGADPLAAEYMVSVGRVTRVDEEDVPGFPPEMVWNRAA